MGRKKLWYPQPVSPQESLEAAALLKPNNGDEQTLKDFLIFCRLNPQISSRALMIAAYVRQQQRAGLKASSIRSPMLNL